MPNCSNPKLVINDILQQSINAVTPYQLLPSQLSWDGNILSVCDADYDLNSFDRLFVIGAGKASADMAVAVESLLGERIQGGLIITKYGHTPRYYQQPGRPVKVCEAGHPIVDKNSLTYTKELLDLLDTVLEDDLVIVLLSGGASSLLEHPPLDIDLQDLITTNELLIRCGADIYEMNSVRRSLSIVKGGGLAKRIFPASGIGLIISDVIGDDTTIIGSGPLDSGSSCVENAWDIVERYNLEDELPESIVSLLSMSSVAFQAQTLPPDDKALSKVDSWVIGSNIIALAAAKKAAESRGYAARILSSEVAGDVTDAARLIVEDIVRYQEEDKPLCLLWGGETTVCVTGNGLGGRNQELALYVLKILGELAPHISTHDVVFCSCGTDGTDGPTDAAGAIVSADTLIKAKSLSISIDNYLANNDAYHFLEKTGSLIKTGPTGTNVMDIMMVLKC